MGRLDKEQAFQTVMLRVFQCLARRGLRAALLVNKMRLLRISRSAGLLW